MKIFLLFLIMSLLTGCSSENTYTVDYELEIGSNYSEKITFYLPKDAYDIADESKDEDFANLEYNLLYTNIKSSFVNDNIYYNKKISKGLSQIKVQLDKKYTEHDFLYSQYINNCFEDYNLLSYKNNFDLKLFGEFYCY